MKVIKNDIVGTLRATGSAVWKDGAIIWKSHDVATVEEAVASLKERSELCRLHNSWPAGTGYVEFVPDSHINTGCFMVGTVFVAKLFSDGELWYCNGKRAAKGFKPYKAA